jgi:hypothetical protein
MISSRPRRDLLPNKRAANPIFLALMMMKIDINAYLHIYYMNKTLFLFFGKIARIQDWEIITGRLH